MGVEDHEAFYSFIRSAPDIVVYNFYHSANALHVVDLINTAAAGIVLHEYFAHLIAELRTWKLLFEGRFMPARMAVIVVRYAWLGAYINVQIFLHGDPPPSRCMVHFRLIYGLYCILWAFSGSIFLMRLNIIFGREKRVMSLYILLWGLGLGIWIFVVCQLTAGALPKTFQYPYGPTCFPSRFPRIGALGWGSSLLFDSAVFLGTVYRYRSTNKSQEKTNQLRSRRWLFRSNLYYFGCSVFFNLACLLSSLLVDDYTLSQIPTPIAFGMHTVTASRLVFNAKGWARGDTIGDDDDIILNTFNKNRRNNTAHITYTIDETVVTSVGNANQLTNHQEQRSENDRSRPVRKSEEAAENDEINSVGSSFDYYPGRTRRRGKRGTLTLGLKSDSEIDKSPSMTQNLADSGLGSSLYFDPVQIPEPAVPSVREHETAHCRPLKCESQLVSPALEHPYNRMNVQELKTEVKTVDRVSDPRETPCAVVTQQHSACSETVVEQHSSTGKGSQGSCCSHLPMSTLQGGHANSSDTDGKDFHSDDFF